MIKSGADGPDRVVHVNPTVSAYEIARAPVPVADDHLRDDAGGLVVPNSSREERRASALRVATKHDVLNERITGAVLAPYREHDGDEARLLAGEVRRAAAEQLFVHAAEERLAAESVPNSTLSKKRKVIGLAAKGAFLVGDTTALGGIFYRAGMPLVLAIPMGLSMAGTVVGAGSQLGREIALHNQRRDRGTAPDDCPRSISDLFDDGQSTERYNVWLTFGLIASGVLLCALSMLGIGLGDPPAVAIGFGLLTALTFVGSAATDAYSTNAAAELIEDCVKRMAVHAPVLVHFEELEARAAAAGRTAHLQLVAAAHAASAAGITTGEVANRATDNPNVFGYEDSGAIETPDTVSAPTELDVADTVRTAAERSRVRMVVQLARPFARAGSDDSTADGRMRSVS
jgi:hypothetical protein